jgi:hypothetical protein
MSRAAGEAGLQGIVVRGAQAGDQGGGSTSAVLRLQRPPVIAGADHLAAVDIEVAELAYAAGGNIAGLASEVRNCFWTVKFQDWM